jgi:hypothetical protein
MRTLKQSKARTDRAQRESVSIDELLAAAAIVRSLVRRAHALTELAEFPETRKAAAVLKKAFESELEKNLIAAYDSLPVPQPGEGLDIAREQAGQPRPAKRSLAALNRALSTTPRA